MASHLTVTTAANPGVSVKGLNAQASAEPTDVFAALLGTITAPEPTVTTTAAATTTTPPADTGLAALADLDLASDEKPDDTPDPIAAVIDAVAPIQTAPALPALAGVIEGLAALQATVQKGEVPTPEAMAKLSTALDALAQALGVSLDQLPSADDLASMATKALPDDAGLAAQLQSALAPAAQDLLSGATSKAAVDPAQADQVKALGEKLAALLQGLSTDESAPDKLAKLAAAPEAPLDADLQAALAKLAKAASVTSTAAAAQTFTPPKLETTEPVLTGKPAEAAAPASSAVATDTPDPVVQADAAPKTDGDDAGDKSDKTGKSDKPRDTKIAAAPAPMQTADATPDPRNTAQPGIHNATRPEALVAPRAVVTGYQTSQQQLNLPQIAFELVRQVNDGNSRFQMRLDPPELGRIDVRLDIEKSGHVTARLTVEKAETLDLMQRDQRGLEKALQQAGIDSSKTSLEFSLKQHSPGQQGQGQGQHNGRQPLFGGNATEAEDTPAPTVNLYRGTLSASGVNILA